MKKKSKLIILIIIVLVITAFTYTIYKSNKNKYFNKLTYSKFFKKWESNDTFPLVISKLECTYCKLYLPKIEKISKKQKIKVYYIEVDSFTAEESSAFSNLINYSGTPTTVFIVNGDEPSKATRINGNTTEEKIINKFKAANFIK